MLQIQRLKPDIQRSKRDSFLSCTITTKRSERSLSGVLHRQKCCLFMLRAGKRGEGSNANMVRHHPKIAKQSFLLRFIGICSQCYHHDVKVVTQLRFTSQKNANTRRN